MKLWPREQALLSSICGHVIPPHLRHPDKEPIELVCAFAAAWEPKHRWLLRACLLAVDLAPFAFQIGRCGGSVPATRFLGLPKNDQLHTLKRIGADRFVLVRMILKFLKVIIVNAHHGSERVSAHFGYDFQEQRERVAAKRRARFAELGLEEPAP